MKFKWNEQKNKSNYRKHRIWFEEAQTIWVDPNSVEFYDPHHSEEEDRFLRVGSSSRLNILLVVFCEANEYNSVRIISARKATIKERISYAKRI